MNETVWVPVADLPMRVDVPDVTLEDLRGERDRARATAVRLEQELAAAEQGAETLAATANRWLGEAERLQGELEYASARMTALDARVARARDICQHANDDWCDDEELPIRPAQILAELEDAPLGGGFSGH